MYVCMYVCMYVYIYTYTHTCMHINDKTKRRQAVDNASPEHRARLPGDVMDICIYIYIYIYMVYYIYIYIYDYNFTNNSFGRKHLSNKTLNFTPLARYVLTIQVVSSLINECIAGEIAVKSSYEDNLAMLHAFMEQMTDHSGIWAGNWHQAAAPNKSCRCFVCFHCSIV